MVEQNNFNNYSKEPLPPSTDLFMVGVLDGHDGAKCADLVAEHLPIKVMQLLAGDHQHGSGAGGPSVHEAHRIAFEECENLMRQKAASSPTGRETSGSCVNSVSVLNGVVYCSNLGDCRAVYIPLADCREWMEVEVVSSGVEQPQPVAGVGATPGVHRRETTAGDHQVLDDNEMRNGTTPPDLENANDHYKPATMETKIEEFVSVASGSLQQGDGDFAMGLTTTASAEIGNQRRIANAVAVSSGVEGGSALEMQRSRRSTKGGNSSTTSSEHDETGSTTLDPEFRSNAVTSTLVRGLTKESLMHLNQADQKLALQGTIPHAISQGVASLASSGGQTPVPVLATRGLTKESMLPTGTGVDGGKMEESSSPPGIMSQGTTASPDDADMSQQLGASSSPSLTPPDVDEQEVLESQPLPPRERSAPLPRGAGPKRLSCPPQQETAMVFTGHYKNKITLGRFSWLSRDFRADKSYERARMRALNFNAIVNGRVCGCLEPSRTIGDLDIKAQIPPGVISIVPETRSVDMARAHGSVSAPGGGPTPTLTGAGTSTSAPPCGRAAGEQQEQNKPRNIFSSMFIPGTISRALSGGSRTKSHEVSSTTSALAGGMLGGGGATTSGGNSANNASASPTAAPPPDKTFHGIIIQGTDGLWDGLSGDEIYTTLMKHSDSILQMQKYLLLGAVGGTSSSSVDGAVGGAAPAGVNKQTSFNPEDPDTIALLEKLAMDLTNVSYRKPDVADDCTAVVTMVSWKY